ncbi:MAG: PAS domain S-box protein, partial [Candidatus Sumerlaeota bacterium]|nr:PAS domain S-box protein [Candidatus Sumerlaeota bacterium]
MPHGKPAKDEHPLSELEALRRRCAELERAAAEAERFAKAFRESEERFGALFDGAGDAIFILDLEGRLLEANRLACERLDFSRDELLRMTAADVEAPEYAALLPKRLAQLRRRGRAVFETAYIRRDGKILAAEASCRVIQFAGQNAVLAVARDIAEHKRAEEALRESRAHLEKILDCVADPIFVKDRRHQFVLANAAQHALVGRERGDLLGKTDHEFFPNEQVKVFWEQEEFVFETGEVSVNEEEVTAAQGQLRILVTKKTLFTDNAGNQFIVGVSRDITERKRAEEALRESRAYLEKILDCVADPIFVKDRRHRYVLANAAECELHGCSREELLGKSDAEYFPKEQYEVFWRQDDAVLESGEQNVNEELITDARGELRTIVTKKTLYVDKQGRPFIVGVIRDITDRKRAEEALQESEELRRDTLESTADGILVVDEAGKVVLANSRFAELWRIPQDLLASRDDAQLLEYVQSQLKAPEAFLAKVQELYQSDQTALDYVEFKDGRVFERFSSPLIREGRLAGRVWSFQDITARRRAEEERRKLEAQMQHVQKLESLGVLAGGIAHDFNNLLTGILGNADLALSDLSPVSPVREHLEEIEHASRRAADLCRQMLAYSGKGRFLLQTLDVSELVEEMQHMLEVSISKKAVLRYEFAPDLPPIEADATQIRQVIMNLVVNASEAIGEKSGVIAICSGAMECDRPYLSETWL